MSDKILIEKVGVTPLPEDIEGAIVNSTNIEDKTTNTYSAEIIDELTGIITVTNSNGTAIKYPDGTMICHSRINITKNIDAPYGSSYYGSAWITLPQNFISIPAITVTIYHSTDIVTTALYEVHNENFGIFLQCAKSKSSTPITINYIAIGRWK